MQYFPAFQFFFLLALYSYPARETGGLTPFQLKYGTEDAQYFVFPSNLEPGERAAEILRKLDANITAVREASARFQAELVEERMLVGIIVSVTEA